MTRQGLVVGTPGYMAPEQAISARDLDPLADLYPLGAQLAPPDAHSRSATSLSGRR